VPACNPSWLEERTIALTERFYPATLLLLVAVGIAMRLFAYLARSPLSTDEAKLAVNVVTATWPDLLAHQLAYFQEVPEGFLVLERLVSDWLGVGEQVLRLVPLVAGLASLGVFFLLARQYLSRGRALLAFALFAVAPGLVRFSGNASHFELDVLVSLVLLYLALRAKKAISWPLALVYAAAGALAVWLSYPAVFVLAASAVCLAWHYLSQRDYSSLGVMALPGLVWLAGFLFSYPTFLDGTVEHIGYSYYWWGEIGSHAFAPLFIRSLDDLKWFPRFISYMFFDPCGLSMVGMGVGVLMFLEGIICGFKRGRLVIFLLLSPLAFAMLSSGFGRYPFVGVYLLFAVPILILVIADGLGAIGQQGQGGFSLAFLACAILLVSLVFGSHRIVFPVADARTVVSLLAEAAGHGDTVVVDSGAKPVFEFYAAKTALDKRLSLLALPVRAEDTELDCNAIKAQIGRAEKVWLFLAADTLKSERENRELERCLAELGALRTSLTADRAGAYLYELSLPQEGQGDLPLPAARQQP